MIRQNRSALLITLVGWLMLGIALYLAIKNFRTLPLEMNFETAAGDNINLQNERLISAVETGDISLVENLLAAGADPNTRVYQEFYDAPILRTAVQADNPLLVKMLLDAGADVNATDSHGNSLLRRAALDGLFEMCVLLLNAGADINAIDGRGNALLPMVVSAREVEIARLLLEYGIDDNGQMRFSHDMGRHGHLEFTCQSLHIASATGNEEMVALLLDYGALVNIPVDTGDGIFWSPLTLAAQRGDVETMRLLIEGGANIDGQMATDVPLIVAVFLSQSPPAVDLLISAGADINRPSHEGYSPLSLAKVVKMSTNRGDEIIELLIAAGAED